MSERGGIHVVPHKGRWAMTREDAARAADRTFPTQEEAIKRGRLLAQRECVEFFIHGMDGEIRSKDSYESDPHPPKRAGGRATQTGMDFQAFVTAWFAVRMLSESPVDKEFRLARGSRVTKLQCETGDAFDDVIAHLAGGGTIHTQCKTSLDLESGESSTIGVVLGQLVRLYLQEGPTDKDAGPNVALLAISQRASRSMDDLGDACRKFDSAESWSDVYENVSRKQRHALDIFKQHVSRAASCNKRRPLTEDDLVAMAKLFRIYRFPEKDGDPLWRATSHLLGRCLYGGDHAGDAPMGTLLEFSRKLIKDGVPVKRWGLLEALRKEGHRDIASPGYDEDIKALKAYSEREQNRFRKHMRLLADGEMKIHRECLDPLRKEVEKGGLLVTGEPGVGKTGVLLALAERMANDSKPLLFLCVESFPGVANQADFRSELKIEHDLADILAAWPGIEPGVLIVDAIDASRGGAAESVMADTLKDVMEAAGGRWSVVASIRSFNLRNSAKIKSIMPGSPAHQDFAEKDLDGVRHFRVPGLSSSEIDDLSRRSCEIGKLVKISPPKLNDLLRNIFNLSLAAELLESGIEAQSIKAIATQSGLIEKYENHRLASHPMKRAVKAAASSMVRRCRLAVRAVDIDSDHVDKVCQAGVFIKHRDRVAFAHHILFDHAVGRFYLQWDDIEALKKQLSGDIETTFILGPALRFALERVWRDTENHETAWRFLADVDAMPEISPVVVDTVLRGIAELVEKPADVAVLLDMIDKDAGDQGVVRLLPRLARHANAAAADRRGMPVGTALAWASVAKRSATAGAADPDLAETARLLLMVLQDKADMADAEVPRLCGEAARALLDAAWSPDSENPLLVNHGIRFVARFYASDPDASRRLLGRIFQERFSEHAWLEASPLAASVQHIFPCDGDFIARVYETIFSHDVTADDETWLGGHPSGVLPLKSTRRQDYQRARQLLIDALADFLKEDPAAGAGVVISAVRGLGAPRDDKEEHQESVAFNISGSSVGVLDDFFSLEEWRGTDDREESPLTVFEDFLRTCGREAFRDVVKTALSQQTNASVWARILGIAAEDRPSRSDLADDLLWPLVNNPRFVMLLSVVRDAVVFITAAYETQPLESRATFEKSMLEEGVFFDAPKRKRWRLALARFLFEVDPESLATPEMKNLRAEMEAEGELVGNMPIIGVSAGWSSDKNMSDVLLRGDGADIEHGPNLDIRTASRKIEERVRSASDNEDAVDLGALWGEIAELVEVLDSGTMADSDPKTVRAGWGAVGDGVERIAKSDSYDPEDPGQPDVGDLLDLIDRLSESPFPEPTDASRPPFPVFWGGWDVRVYAASSLIALAPRFGEESEEMVSRMREFLSDPVASVRLKVAGTLHTAGMSPDQMLSLMEYVATAEKHEGVLYFFISAPLQWLSRKRPEACADLLSKIIERKWSASDDGHRQDRDRAVEAAGQLTSYLSLAKDQQKAWAWVERWANEPKRGENYLVHTLPNLRHALFLPYGDEPTHQDLDVASRGRRLLEITLDAASLLHSQDSDAGDEAAAAERLPQNDPAGRMISAICNELYIGSGASKNPRHSGRKAGLKDTDGKQKFIADYAEALVGIGKRAQPRTVYRLIGILEYLADSNPGDVFDLTAEIFLESATHDGFRLDPIGQEKAMSMVRRYIDNHRKVFDGPVRKQKLVDMLNLFASAGWSDAAELLSKLPSILR